MRPTLPDQQVHPEAMTAIEKFHADVIANAQRAITENDWVIIGMATNPFVKKARQLLQEKQISFKYIEHGGYLSQWKQRLAIKLWSGWPTFPQVFHKGRLIGGYSDLKKYL